MEKKLDEESKALLRRILERQAYRQLVAANIRGHALKLVPEIEEKVALIEELRHSLAVLREVERLYAGLGGGGLALAVRDKMEKIPYPATRLELSVCLALCDRAELAAAQAYAGSACGDMAAIARTLLEQDRASAQKGEELFATFCAEPGNLSAAQPMFNRWLAIALAALGRPGTPGDRRAVALEVRTRRCAECVQRFLEELKPFVARCGLAMPAPASIGVELPAELAAVAASIGAGR